VTKVLDSYMGNVDAIPTETCQ